MNKTILDYFDDSEDYPKEVAHDPLPYGIVWNYISNTFLNGFINYVKPIKVYQLDRYTGEDESLDVDYLQIRAGIGGEFSIKSNLRKLVINNEIQFMHTKLNVFGDDIIILAKIEGNENGYMFFQFDCDVSDCSIGKFETTDSVEDVVQSVVNWLEAVKQQNKNAIFQEGHDNGILNYTELPLSFLQGWISF